MTQPTWTASIAAQLDELRIHFDGDTHLLAARVADSLERYRFALIRGIGQEEGTRQEAIDVLLQLGNLLGEVMPLSPLGEQIQDVRDFSDTDDKPDTRGYRSGGEIRPHTDPATLILLHCLTPARTGGESVIVNVRTIHDI
ncbi:MAG TPA: TauD/TfdA family dioxygenase, partial [Myxococcota bacterium]|nr:TauD/TfdA family dioxygenase [Myxococcota bacterium]